MSPDSGIFRDVRIPGVGGVSSCDEGVIAGGSKSPGAGGACNGRGGRARGGRVEVGVGAGVGVGGGSRGAAEGAALASEKVAPLGVDMSVVDYVLKKPFSDETLCRLLEAVEADHLQVWRRHGDGVGSVEEGPCLV